ncbi:hypothetical protein TAMC210_20650 [Thermanaeromonas sp. C210]|nr:hypothetical protein TAMC210_20650 [Thermanaeromonas sp. C210]
MAGDGRRLSRKLRRCDLMSGMVIRRWLKALGFFARETLYVNLVRVLPRAPLRRGGQSRPVSFWGLLVQGINEDQYLGNDLVQLWGDLGADV